MKNFASKMSTFALRLEELEIYNCKSSPGGLSHYVWVIYFIRKSMLEVKNNFYLTIVVEFSFYFHFKLEQMYSSLYYNVKLRISSSIL